MSEQAITGTPTRGPGRRAALDDRSPRRWSAPGRFFPRTEVSADLRTLHRSGGRQADDFYRDRCNHDKVVRSTHAVNCTGSCSWEVYVKERGDWWDASYLIMWASNVPVSRTPDEHWMAEARYRGQKVVAVSPDYADNVKFADEWLAAQPGTDGALAMAMGHVTLKKFWTRQRVSLCPPRLAGLPVRPRGRRQEEP